MNDWAVHIDTSHNKAIHDRLGVNVDRGFGLFVSLGVLNKNESVVWPSLFVACTVTSARFLLPVASWWEEGTTLSQVM